MTLSLTPHSCDPFVTSSNARRIPAALLLIVLAAFVCQRAAAMDDPPVTSVLPDGVRVIVQQETSSQLVAITVLVKAGSAQENPNDAGIGSMVADALLTGTSNEDADTIAQSIGAIGGNVKAIWQPDFTQIRALVLPSQFQDAAYLLSDVLKNANFTDESVENARQDLLARLQERSDDVFDTADDLLRESLYSGTAYSLPEIGTVETIKHLTSEDLRLYFHRYYRPNDMTISIVGNVDPDTAISVFGGNLTDFVRAGSRREAETPVLIASSRQDPLLIKKYRGDVTAGLMLVGYTAPGVGTTDYPAMLVANALLGGMKTSLMFENLRTKNGYGYEVASTYNTQLGVSDVTGYILYSLTPPDGSSKLPTQTPIVKQAMLDQFKAMIDSPPSETDLVRAKKFVIGSYILDHERIEDRSYYLGYAEVAFKDLGGYKYDENYAYDINAVTAADVQRVCKECFSGGPVISLLLPGDPNAGVEND